MISFILDLKWIFWGKLCVFCAIKWSSLSCGYANITTQTSLNSLLLFNVVCGQLRKNLRHLHSNYDMDARIRVPPTFFIRYTPYCPSNNSGWLSSHLSDVSERSTKDVSKAPVSMAGPVAQGSALKVWTRVTQNASGMHHEREKQPWQTLIYPPI